MRKDMYDCVIIGAGVIGAAAARELSKYELNILVLEKGEDVCVGTSKANSGLVHAGFDAKPGSLKAEMNVKGNAMMKALCKELDVPFRQTGALVLAFSEEEKEILKTLKRQGEQNGVPELSILDKEALLSLEPNLAEQVTAGLFAGTAGIVCPFKLTIAMAENANVNGAAFSFLSEVRNICKKQDEKGVYYELWTEIGRDFTLYGEESRENRIIRTRTVVNCAGLYSDVLHNMVSSIKYRIIPRRGEYCLLDKSAGGHVGRTIFKVPGPLGKGILVTPTVHGNLLLGPTAEDIENKEDTATTGAGLENVLQSVGRTVKDIPINQVITSFAGLRAHVQIQEQKSAYAENGDFIIREAEDAEGFIDAAGIESPGLTSAPAIGERLASIVADKLKPKKKSNFAAFRKDIVHLRDLPEKEQRKLIKAKPEYSNVICRCEMITEGEILDAVYRPLGAKSLDGVKRRTRAGMGRCQAGFCSPKVLEILAEAYKVSPLCISKNGPGSELLSGEDGEIANNVSSC